MGAQLRVGVDENGLGPRLGPLVVTAAGARVGEGVDVEASLVQARAAGLLGDSKGLVSFHDDALGEAWARVLVARQGGGTTSPNAVLEALLHDDRQWLRALCPEAHAGQCWGTEDERFQAPDALVARVADLAAELHSAGIALLLPKVALRCTARLNEALLAGISRFDADLRAMEALVASCMHEGELLHAVCGKVGSRDRYLDAFKVLPAHEVVFFEEGRAESVYRFGTHAVVRFIKDADASDSFVGLASLVGKWVRDLLMDRIVRHHQRAVPDAPRVSGYHDPKTARFVEVTRLARKASGLPDTCFERAKREVAS
jgi:ribonuclease HII